MDAKYLGVTLSNDLEWSKHIATMTNKANSNLSFLRRNLEHQMHTSFIIFYIIQIYSSYIMHAFQFFYNMVVYIKYEAMKV